LVVIGLKRIDNLFEKSRYLDRISKIDVNDKTEIVFLLGAGASASSNIPTVNLMLPELLKKGKENWSR
jgi:hypothetical protein